MAEAQQALPIRAVLRRGSFKAGGRSGLVPRNAAAFMQAAALFTLTGGVAQRGAAG